VGLGQIRELELLSREIKPFLGQMLARAGNVDEKDSAV
jgi:hypothetical protein